MKTAGVCHIQVKHVHKHVLRFINTDASNSTRLRASFERHVCVSGLLHHNGDKVSFSSRFGQGSIIGVHLDTWHGTLTFYKNRKCIGESYAVTFNFCV